MKKSKILYSLVIFVIFILFPTLNFTFSQIESSFERNELKSSAYWELTPFVIDDTGAGDYNWSEAILEDWCSGSGTPLDPFVIENVTINGANSASCIEIRESSVYFIIQNCTLINSAYDEAGIYLDSVANGILINNNCSSNNGFGIFTYFSYDNFILENIANNNIIGIYLYECNQTTISENEVNENSNKGIYLRTNSHYNEILNNAANDNLDSGICLSDCNYTDIIDNIASNNKWDGIHLYGSDYNNIIQNTIEYNQHYGISLLGSSYNTIIGNNIRSILSCIEEDDESHDNEIRNNLCNARDAEIPGINILLIIGIITIVSIVIVMRQIKKIKN